MLWYYNWRVFYIYIYIYGCILVVLIAVWLMVFILLMFSVFVGSGVQLCCMGVATLTFALLGLLSPANRGSLITAFILLFVFMGSFAGYYSSSIYKMFRGILWKQNTLMTAFFYPGVVFSIIFVLNLILWVKGSSGAIPFGSLFTLLFLWFCVSVPLVFLGSFFGYKRWARCSASSSLCCCCSRCGSSSSLYDIYSVHFCCL